MTNYEHYKKQIEKFTRMGRNVAVKKDTNEIIPCADDEALKEEHNG